MCVSNVWSLDGGAKLMNNNTNITINFSVHCAIKLNEKIVMIETRIKISKLNEGHLYSVTCGSDTILLMQVTNNIKHSILIN